MDENHFRNMFDHPNLNQWHELSHDDFLAFIRYIFHRAGCATDKFSNHGADLIVREGDKVVAYVKAQNHIGHVGSSPVLQLAGIEVDERVPRYIITTGDFAKSAYDEVTKHSRLNIKLANGPRLKRYVDYISGTRFENSKSPAIRLDCLYEADHVAEVLGQAKTQVLVVANNKGGVGKTTTALNICYGLAKLGKNVLAIDFDPQANLTLALLQSETRVDLHLGHYIEKQRQLGELVRKSQFEHICVIPSQPALRLAFIDMRDWYQRELTFAEQLLQPDVTHHPEIGQGAFDWIVIDTPPDMGFFTRCALAAANYVLIPLAPDIASSTGTRNIIDTIKAIQAFIGSETRVNILGAFITKFDSSQKTIERINAVIDPLRKESVEILQTPIRDDNNVRRGYDESIKRSMHKAFDLFAREGHAGTDYQQLVKEILDYVSYP